MALSANITPIFGPNVDTTVLLPSIPGGLSSDLDASVRRYTAAYLEQHPADDGEAVAEIVYREAHRIATIPAASHTDMAAKLLIGLHDSHPAILDGKLALDAGSFETDACARILLSVVDDLLALIETPGDPGEWRTLLDAQAAAHATTMEKDLDEDELSRRCDAEDVIVRRLLYVPPRSAQEFVEKLRIVFGWSYSPARAVLDTLLLDGQRVISGQHVERKAWDAPGNLGVTNTAAEREA